MPSDSQNAADRINTALPVHLTGADVDQNPEFLRLLHVLSRHITRDGTTSSVHKDLEQAQGELRQEKSRWLEQHVLYSELQELLLDQQLQNVQSTPSANNQFYTVVGEMLTTAEIGDYVDCHPDPSSDTTLLGLRRDDLDRRNPHKRHVSSVQQKLIPEIELRLRKKCETLVGFHDCCNNIEGQTESKNLTFAKASQLPSILETEQNSLATEKRLLQQDKASRDKQLKKYIQTLRESLETLELLVSRHRLQSQPQNDTISGEWLTARCDAMCLKVKTLELQLLCDTYYGDTIQALSTIKGHLDRAVSETEIEVHKAREALKAYEAVGMGFEDLVEEYTQLKLDSDNKKWALREITQSKDHTFTQSKDDTFS